MDWTLREGYSWPEDQVRSIHSISITRYLEEHCEEDGRMLQADHTKVSDKAKKRGLPQVYSFMM